jgi:ceramide glucosyltransferase
MSLLIKKKILDECGGLQAFGNYIAEDYFIPKAFHQLGYKTRVANEPAWQNSALSSFDIWRARMIRWTQLRLRFCRAAWLEPLVSCFGQAFLTSFSFLILTNSICISTIYFAAHVALWFFLDIFMIQTIENGNFRHELSKCFCAWLYREFTSYIFFIMSSYNPYVIWKNGTFKLKSDGTGVRIN